MLKEFRSFLLRGNVVDLAVAVVLGTAFGAAITALVRHITPIIALVFGKHDFSALTFTINHSIFRCGDFVNYVITFLSVAAAVFFLIGQPINLLMRHRHRDEADGSDTRPCTECLSEIPRPARRCAYCTATQRPMAA